jgi:hypothetical protein
MDSHQFALYAALSFQTIAQKWNTWKSEEIVVVTIFTESGYRTIFTESEKLSSTRNETENGLPAACVSF